MTQCSNYNPEICLHCNCSTCEHASYDGDRFTCAVNEGQCYHPAEHNGSEPQQDCRDYLCAV